MRRISIHQPHKVKGLMQMKSSSRAFGGAVGFAQKANLITDDTDLQT
jgi:hypothetical protein